MSTRQTSTITMSWPEALRAGLRVRRGRGAPPRARKIKVSELWGGIYESYRYGMNSTQWTPARATEDCRRLMAEAFEALDGPGPVVERSSPELEAALRRIAPGPLDWKARWIDLWNQSRGLVFALQALFASWQLSVEAPVWPGPGWLVRGFVNDEQIDHDFQGSASPGLRTRALLSAADEATYEACLREAARLREGAPFQVRCAVALLFPEQAAWVDESCREALAITDRPIWHRSFLLELLACASDLELALACAGKMDLQTVARVAGELADTFGPGIIDLLLRIFATDDWAYKDDRAHVAEVLSIFGTDRVAGAMMECLKSKGLRAIGQAWCARFPDLARPELERLAARKSKVAPVAAEVLASLPARP